MPVRAISLAACRQESLRYKARSRTGEEPGRKAARECCSILSWTATAWFRGAAMTVKQLLSWVDQPETHRKIVGDYEGSYMLGVTDDPPAFVLRVEPNAVLSFPTKVTIHDVEVPVIVQGGFVPPQPTASRR